jgi:hypothetical protein
MKKLGILVVLFTIASLSYAQADKMTNEKLNLIITAISTDVQGGNGNWQFTIDSTYFVCLTDENHNRMRIISPIMEVSDLTTDEMTQCMEANFHSMLDSKYAIGEGLVWSAFIHPLGELTEDQFLSAVSQVFSGVRTFGTYYSSGLLEFPKKEDRATPENKEAVKVKKI